MSSRSSNIECPNCHTMKSLTYKQLLTLNKSLKCKKCETILLPKLDADFDNLAPGHYVHHLDSQALSALKKVPGIDTLLRALIKQSFELATRLHHQASFIRVSKDQLSSINDKLVIAAKRIGMTSLPEIYVYQDPTPNAYTFGVSKNFIAISTGCIELLNDDELLCVIAHELGHIHAEHVLYKTASRILSMLAGRVAQSTLGLGGIIMYPLQIALIRWDRTSELSADRAALLVVKEPQIVMSTLMKLSGGTKALAGELNIESFIEQADSFKSMEDEGFLGKYISVFNTLFKTHPHSIWRAKEILTWAKSDYLTLLQGPKLLENKCTKCGDVLPAKIKECPKCAPPKSDSKNTPSQTPNITKAWSDAKDWYNQNFK